VKTTDACPGWFIKRGFDVVVALVGLIVLALPLALVAILIRLDSKGPVIFRQERIGQNSVPFTIYKFRTMAAGNNEGDYLRQLALLIHGDPAADGHKQPYRKIDTDPRITRLGYWLRRTYLDELPQLWNVLRGNMSLVGPRPHVQLEVDAYDARQRGRLAVRPGITGLWQWQGKQTATFDEMIAQDLEYIANWSFWRDIRIIAGTLGQLLAVVPRRQRTTDDRQRTTDGGPSSVHLKENAWLR
jgi:lipopolysaccharide/colanic/teichoic acid biosynthesis glycosyltransferase